MSFIIYPLVLIGAAWCLCAMIMYVWLRLVFTMKHNEAHDLMYETFFHG